MNNKLHYAITYNYVVFLEGNLCGFFSLIPLTGHAGYRNYHRIVVLPEYQGIGISNKVMEILSKKYYEEGKRVGIVSSAPSMYHQLNKNKNWTLVRRGRSTSKETKSDYLHMNNANSVKRYTFSFVYTPQKK